jgi:hypothetical protein
VFCRGTAPRRAHDPALGLDRHAGHRAHRYPDDRSDAQLPIVDVRDVTAFALKVAVTALALNLAGIAL